MTSDAENRREESSRASAPERSVEETMEQSRSGLDQLLKDLRQAGETLAPELIERAKAFGSVAVPALIGLATDDDLLNGDSDTPEVWAPLHAIQIIGELRAAEAVGSLLPLIRVNDDWISEKLPEVFGKIGEPALAPMCDLLRDRTQDVYARSRAASTLKEIAENHPELRQTAVAALVAQLQPGETQSPDDETLNGFVITELVDLKAKDALPAIRRAYEEDRVDESVTDWDDVATVFDLPGAPRRDRTRAEDGIDLRLRCLACGYERSHHVARVYYDLNTADRRKRGEQTKYSEFIIPQRITCPKCGAVDQYELGTFAQIALMGELLRQGLGQDMTGARVNPEDSPLQIIRFGLTDGRPMHPYDAREMYRQQVESEPGRSDLRVKYANVLEKLGYHEDAVIQYRKALELDPTNLEACVSLGQFYYGAGRVEEARWMLERVVELEPRSQLPRQKKEEFVEYARESLAEMAGIPVVTRPRLSPARVEDGRKGSVSVSARPLAAGSGARKVGRNEPCPCGSGKKYKKCCGR